MIDDEVPAKLKHFSAQVAMVPQSMALSHGFAFGQQSCMSSIADMSACAGDLTLTPAPAAAGSSATDRATRSARMVRPMLMYQAWRKIAGPLVPRSSDEFARCPLLNPFTTWPGIPGPSRTPRRVGALYRKRASTNSVRPDHLSGCSSRPVRPKILSAQHLRP
jgi:hypothetical protein